MSSASPSSTAPSRYLAVSLPRLSTDRILRERLGRSWLSDAHPEGQTAPAAGPVSSVFRDAAGSAHRSRAALAFAPGPVPQGRAPLALYEKIGGAQRLVALCEAAARLGLAPGLGVAEARARFPRLELAEADRPGDARLLEAVADWCDRYTPLVALDGPSRLILDISGCAHLFGGEAALVADLSARLTAQGLAVRTAVAGAAGTAQALVDHASGARLEAGEEREALAPLPIAALRLEPQVAAMLARLGLKRLGEMFELPRAGLARRFGQALGDRLDEALGDAPVPIVPRRPVPLIIHERRLFEPISRTEDILGLLETLAPRLALDLERRGEVARRLALTLFRVDGRIERLDVGTAAPTRDPIRLVRLFAERLKGLGDDLDAGFGYDLVRLGVEACDPLAERQGDLGSARDGGEPVEVLLDRLAARLGEAAVLGLDEIESHRPERAEAFAAALRRELNATLHAEAFARPDVPRPLRLLAPPEPVEATAGVPEGAPEQFRWRRAHHRVVRVEGPERIAPEWWREDAGETRDYFRVEDMEGRRFWLFREGRLAPSGAPAWFMHGLFA